MTSEISKIAGLCLCLGACQARAIETLDDSNEEVALSTADSNDSPAAADPPGTLLTWDRDGKIFGADNPFGIRGGWARAWDCDQVQAAIAAGTLVCSDPAPTPGCCTVWDPSITGPDLQPGWSVTSDRDPPSSNAVCVKGTASQVLEDVDGVFAFGTVWGANFGIVLNDYASFDASMPFPGGPIRGFSFDLTGSPMDRVRVGVNTPDDANDFFKEYIASVTGATVIFSEVRQGDWVEPPATLDISRLGALNFTFITGTERPTPFDVCVSNVRVLQ